MSVSMIGHYFDTGQGVRYPNDRALTSVLLLFQEITALRESLNSFQFYMKEQHNQMRSLKDEMHTLELKLTEGGLGLKIERRLQQVYNYRDSLILDKSCLGKIAVWLFAV